MDYLEIKNHIRTDNQNLLKFIKKEEILWLEKHFKFINGLLMGRIKVEELDVLPIKLKKYKDFIATIRKEKEPTTDEEKIYLKFIEYFNQEMKKKNIKKTRAELTDPLVYKTRQKQDVKFYDLDEDMSSIIYKELDDYVKEGTLPDGSLRHDDHAVVGDTFAALGRENVTLGEFIRESRKIANYDYDMYSYEHAEGILQIIEDRLKKEGFGGYTHQGGLYAGKGKRKHQVRIYWDPGNQLELGKTSI